MEETGQKHTKDYTGQLIIYDEETFTITDMVWNHLLNGYWYAGRDSNDNVFLFSVDVVEDCLVQKEKTKVEIDWV